MGSFKAKVRLEHILKDNTLLNTGAEINVMTRKIIEDISLAIQRDLKLELVYHISHSRFFLSFCEDIKVSMGGLKTRHSIFILETGDHDLVLGQPFLKSVKFSQKYKPDGIYGTITHFYIQCLAIFRTLAPQNLAN